MYKIKNQKGFVGLLVLLIATAIIGYLSYSALIQEGDKPQIQGLIDQIDKAEELSKNVKERVKKINEEMGEYASDVIDKQSHRPGGASKINVTLKIGAENPSEYTKEMDKEKSAFDLMKLIDEENEDFSFEYQDSSLGAFIEEINGVKNDASNNIYWMFYVNDKIAEVGASQYILLDNDIIEWKYEDMPDLW